MTENYLLYQRLIAICYQFKKAGIKTIEMNASMFYSTAIYVKSLLKTSLSSIYSVTIYNFRL